MPRKSKKPNLKSKAKKVLNHIGGASDRFWDEMGKPPTVDLVGKRRLQGKSGKKKKSRKRK